MNKKLFEKVTSLCKDTGLSEKYLKAITEKLGGSIEDDSTDEAAIETTANLIKSVADESQGEATRWAQKPKPTPKPEPKPEPEPKPDPKNTDPALKAIMDKLEAQEKELKELKDLRAKGERTKTIQSLMETHKIPAYLRATLEKSIADGDDAEETIKSFKQGLITNGLEPGDPEGKKVASEKQVDEAADSLLESITAK